jgi:hypothetical protein
MKRAALTLTLVFAFSILVITGLQTPLVKANPAPGKPVISIYSPSNQTYNSNLLTLNMSVYCFAGDFGTKWIGFSLDNGDNITITTTEGEIDTLNGLVFLPDVLPLLSDGGHSISVYALYNFSDLPWWNADGTPLTPSSTETVYFIIDPASPNVPELTTIVIPIFALATLFAAFRLRRIHRT